MVKEVLQQNKPMSFKEIQKKLSDEMEIDVSDSTLRRELKS